MVAADRRCPRRSSAVSVAELGDAADRGEGRRHLVAASGGSQRLERGLDGRGASAGVPSEKRTSARRCRHERLRAVLEASHFSQSAGHEVALRRRSRAASRRRWRDLLLLDGLDGGRARRPRPGWRAPRRACRRAGRSSLGRRSFAAGAEPLDLGQVARWPSRTRRAGWRASRRARGAAAGSPCRRPRARPRAPRSTQRRASSMRRACQAVSAASSDARRRRAPAASPARRPGSRPRPPAARRRCRPPCGSARARSSRASPSSAAVALPLLVEELEGGLRGRGPPPRR